MFRPTRPSSGVLKFGGTAVPSGLLRSVFLNEVNVIPPPMPHVLLLVRCVSSVQCGCYHNNDNSHTALCVLS
jgi:hypothetical protein